jgi:glycerol-3-phosphate dehydrogenase
MNFIEELRVLNDLKSLDFDEIKSRKPNPFSAFQSTKSISKKGKASNLKRNINIKMARTIDDILARRVRLLFLDARAAIACSEKVGELLVKELGYDEAWKENQIASFKALANGFLLKEFRVQ